MPKTTKEVAVVKKAKKDYSAGISVRGPTRLISDASFLSGQSVSGPGIAPLSFDRIAAIHAWVFACLKAISQNIGVVPLRFTTGKGDNPQPFTEEDSGAKGELAKLFANPNPYMAGFQLWETTSQMMNLDGTVFWILERENLNQIPQSIHVVRVTCMDAIVARDNKTILGWLYKDPVTQMPQRFTLDQVLVFKFSNPYDPFFGLSPLSAAARGITLDVLAANYSQSFFENSADPSGVIISEKKLSENQAKQIIEWWEARHRGSSVAKKIGILYGGMKYQATGISQKDMEFLQQRQWTRDEVLAVFKVPKSEISLDEGANFSNTIAQDKGFWQKTLIPILKNFEAVLKGHFIPGLRGIIDANLKITFDLASVSALQPDFTEQLKAAEALARIGYPVNDINERLKLGMPKKEWGDTWYLNGAILSVQQVLAGVGRGVTDVTGATVPGNNPSHPAVPGATGNLAPDANSPNTPRDPTPPSATGQTTPSNYRGYDELYQSLINPAEIKIKEQLKSHFWRLRTHMLAKIVRDGRVYGFNEWHEKLEKRLQPIISQLGVAISTKINKNISPEFIYDSKWDYSLHEQFATEISTLKDSSSEVILNRMRSIFNQLSDQAKLADIAKMEIYNLLKKLESA